MDEDDLAFMGRKGKPLSGAILFREIRELTSSYEGAADSRAVLMPADGVEDLVGVPALCSERKVTFELQNKVPALRGVTEDLETEPGLRAKNFRDVVGFLAGIFRQEIIETF